MPVQLQIYFTDYFKVSSDTLEEYGAFDISLVNDLPLFIDPFLLFNSKKHEYQQLHQEIIAYLRFLRSQSTSTNISQGLIDTWYRFPEVRQTWLGYSGIGNYGRGLGQDFASALHTNLHKIFSNFGSETVTRSSHLEKLCLIKSGVGRDNISDFATNLIKRYLLEYTQEFARQHISPKLLNTFSIPKVRFNYVTQSWVTEAFELPTHENDYVLLTPKDLLTRNETWINNSDFRTAKTFREIAEALPDNSLRSQIDNYLKRALAEVPTTKFGTPKKKEAEKAVQEAIEQLIAKHPELIDHYIRYKEDREQEATTVSEENVQLAEVVFIEKVKELVLKLSQDTSFYGLQHYSNTREETLARIGFLKDVIENKGGHRIFYIEDKPLRRETDLHILFRLVWFATISDVTREANDGRGPVDFKISRGSQDKTIAEFKLASNTQLRRNLEKQAEVYQKASDANSAIKVIIYFTDTEKRKVEQIIHELGFVLNSDIVLIDARKDNKPSGSKA